MQRVEQDRVDGAEMRGWRHEDKCQSHGSKSSVDATGEQRADLPANEHRLQVSHRLAAASRGGRGNSLSDLHPHHFTTRQTDRQTHEI